MQFIFENEDLSNLDVGDHIHSKDSDVKYKVVRTLGEGGYGMVLCCNDESSNTEVAVKVSRHTYKYRGNCSSLFNNEARKLFRISMSPGEGSEFCIQFVSSFLWRRFYCLVCTPVGETIHDVMKLHDCQPFPLSQVVHISLQLCQGLNYLHYNMMMTHGDVKPANVIFVNQTVDVINKEDTGEKIYVLRDCSIKLIDFGHARYCYENHPPVVSTQPYRAPEIFLGLEWSHPCDMWSLGCTMFELATGYMLFKAHSTLSHLTMMFSILGPFPELWSEIEILKQMKTTDSSSDSDVDSADLPTARCRRMKKFLEPVDQKRNEFMDVICKVLTYEPSQRYNAAIVVRLLKKTFFNILH